MHYDIKHVLDEIELLTARMTIAKRDGVSKNEYIALLSQLKAQYDCLTILYSNKSENYLMCQSLLSSANITAEICEIEPSKFINLELYSQINRLCDATNDCYDLNLCRSAYVAVGKLYYFLGEYALSEKYFKMAFEDYDYSIPTFRLYINVLDRQKKFKEMLSLMEKYLSMDTGYHEKCSIKDFSANNILHSPYASAYKHLFKVRGSVL